MERLHASEQQKVDLQLLLSSYDRERDRFPQAAYPARQASAEADWGGRKRKRYWRGRRKGRQAGMRGEQRALQARGAPGLEEEEEEGSRWGH